MMSQILPHSFVTSRQHLEFAGLPAILMGLEHVRQGTVPHLYWPHIQIFCSFIHVCRIYIKKQLCRILYFFNGLEGVAASNDREKGYRVKNKKSYDPLSP